MTVEERARRILRESGRKQSWLIQQMNAVDTNLNVTPSQISETLNGKREMTVPEFLAFCVVTNTEPSSFYPIAG